MLTLHPAPRPRPQIPKTAGEPEILAVFAPFGEVEQINILKSKGIHAGAPAWGRAACCRCWVLGWVLG